MLRLLKTVLFCSGCLGLSLALNACSFSNSSASLSDSSGSLSKSSESFSDSVQSLSRSSTSLASKGGEQYENDVVDYTYAYLKSTSTGATDYNGFLKGLSGIAAEHGITDWEADAHTYVAIGKGLKKARIAGVSYETYKKNFAGSDAAKMRDIQKGYESLD